MDRRHPSAGRHLDRGFRLPSTPMQRDFGAIHWRKTHSGAQRFWLGPEEGKPWLRFGWNKYYITASSHRSSLAYVRTAAIRNQLWITRHYPYSWRLPRFVWSPGMRSLNGGRVSYTYRVH